MKTLLISLAVACAALTGCAVAPYGYGYSGYPAYGSVSVYGDGGGYRSHGQRSFDRDRDRDGIPNRRDADRDGDGVPNRWDNRPNNFRRD